MELEEKIPLRLCKLENEMRGIYTFHEKNTVNA